MLRIIKRRREQRPEPPCRSDYGQNGIGEALYQMALEDWQEEHSNKQSAS